jgi:hypothetical protein
MFIGVGLQFCQMTKLWRSAAQQCEYSKHYCTAHFKMIKMSWALVAHTRKTSYSGGRDQEDLA